MAFLGAGENLMFVIALVVMLLIGLVEAVGLGSSAFGHDLGIESDADWLGWLGFGRLPALLLIVLYLAVFGAIGLLGQQLALDHLGGLLSGWIAGPAAAVAALPLTGLLSRPLARILPGDETSAIEVAGLVGRYGEILVGTARAGHPAKARVRDQHGHAHYVMVEPTTDAQSFAEGTEVLLVDRDTHVFRAIPSERAAFSNWIER